MTYAFTGGTNIQRGKFEKCLLIWTRYIHLSFKEVQSNADVRIDFVQDGSGSWTYLGQQARRVPNNLPTMVLDGIGSEVGMSSRERSTMLHEIGHLLGLVHEHQSPARGDVLCFKRRSKAKVAMQNQVTDHLLETMRYFRRFCGWTKRETKHQVLKKLTASSYSRFDTKSIMM